MVKLHFPLQPLRRASPSRDIQEIIQEVKRIRGVLLLRKKRERGIFPFGKTIGKKKSEKYTEGLTQNSGCFVKGFER